MASCAAAMKERGYQVSGSDDSVYPPMSTFLAEQGITIHQGYDPAHFSTKPDWVVIGNALSRGNAEVEHVLANKWIYLSLPELLREVFIRGKRSIVVTGTHGKSTTTSLIAWILDQAGWNPSYLIGGLPSNFSRGARFTDSEWIVLEGDEYDTAFFDKRSKFIHYLPEIGIVHNLEFDHADIFDDLAQIQTSFRRMVNLIPRNGVLVANGDDPNVAELMNIDHCPVQRFGLRAGNEVRGEALCFSEEGSAFQVGSADYALPMAGELNVRNALAVVAVARHCGLSEIQIQSAFETFQGIKRRMEVRGEVNGITVIDDFAHHPTAIAETLKAARVRFPKRRVWAIFEPRSNTTRRAVFQDDLAVALSGADSVVVAAVARLDQLPEGDRLNPDALIESIKSGGTEAAYLPDADAIATHVVATAKPGDVICVLSNGGFGGVLEKLLVGLKA